LLSKISDVISFAFNFMQAHQCRSGLLFEPAPGIVLRDYQLNTVKKLLQNFYDQPVGGVLVVPCGFGKTIITLCAAGIVGCPFIVLVPSTEIAVQWSWQLFSCFRTAGKPISPQEIGMVCGRLAPPKPPEWREVATHTMTADDTDWPVARGVAVFVMNAASTVESAYWHWARQQFSSGRSSVLDGGVGLLYVPAQDSPSVSLQLRWLAVNKALVTIGTSFTVELTGRELHVFVCPTTSAHYRDMILRQTITNPEALSECKVVIASVASIAKEGGSVVKHRQLNALRSRFPLTILDEAHHFADKADSNTFSQAVQMVSCPRGRKWGLTATLLRQDRHTQDVVREFGTQIHAVAYHENTQAVNLHIDRITLAPSSTWSDLVQRVDSSFETGQILEALSPVKLVAVMDMLTNAIVQGRQGLVFFGRRVVQDVYWQMLQSTGAVRVHGRATNEGENNTVQRCAVRERIADYDRDSSAPPTIVFTTNCWETGVDLPEIEFTLFVNEVCEGRRHVVQAAGRATRTDPRNADKKSLACILTTAGTREDRFGGKLIDQLKQSYGENSHCVQAGAVAATNFLLDEKIKGDGTTTPCDDNSFRRFVDQRLQHAQNQIEVSEALPDSCVRTREKKAWHQYVDWLRGMLRPDSILELWRTSHKAINARAAGSSNKRPRPFT